MPGCVLRVESTKCPLPEQLVTSRRPSGFLFYVGEGKRECLAEHIEDSLVFLSQHSQALAAAAKDVDFHAQLDFGVWSDPAEPFSRSFVFPLPLVASASACGVELVISIYSAH